MKRRGTCLVIMWKKGYCVFFLIKQFFLISKNRSINDPTRLIIFSGYYYSYYTVGDGSGKTKRHTNTALEATGLVKKNTHTRLTRPRSTGHNTRGRVEYKTRRVDER